MKTTNYAKHKSHVLLALALIGLSASAFADLYTSPVTRSMVDEQLLLEAPKQNVKVMANKQSGGSKYSVSANSNAISSLGQFRASGLSAANMSKTTPVILKP